MAYITSGKGSKFIAVVPEASTTTIATGASALNLN